MRLQSMTALNAWALFLLISLAGAAQGNPALPGQFDPNTDLFLPQFDSKTDVDDLHSVAAVATVLNHPDLERVRFHAVAGAYGIQEGLYVPSPELFDSAFEAHWSDAHGQREQALDRVTGLAKATLQRGGSVWVAEAGQSDFTADWLRRIEESGEVSDLKNRVHVVQHSDWNESVTDAQKLDYVKKHASYHRIPDGNSPDNGTPGFNSPASDQWARVLADPAVGPSWLLARDIANRYNGIEERYLNESIAAGGMDFSDTVETCWIFGCVELRDARAFFDAFLPSQPAMP